MGLKSELKNLPVRKNHSNNSNNHLKESFWDSIAVLKKIFPFILMGAFIGAFIHEFLPTDLITNVTTKNTLVDIPIASALSLPLHIHHLSIVIPAAHALLEKGLNMGVIISIIIAGAGLSIAEVTLLSAVFKKRLIAIFSASIFLIAVFAGYIFMLT